MTSAPLALIVDDNGQNLKLAADVLRAAGFHTLGGASGAEGIALAKEHHPDVILMDLGLPDMSGADAARAIKEGASTADVPIVAMSASQVRGSDWLLAAGFAGTIGKPIDIASFPDQVRSYVRPGDEHPGEGVPAPIE